jgi:hypothetical protein
MLKTITVNGKEADLSKALPLNLRDWREIKKRSGYDVMRTTVELEHLIAIATHAFQKANPEITEDEVLDLDLKDLNKISAMAAGGDEEVDRPT